MAPGRPKPLTAPTRDGQARGLVPSLTAPRNLLVALGLVIALVLVAWGVFVHRVEARVLEALGPRATVGSMHLRYPTLVLEDVSITADGAPYAWPAAQEAEVARIEFTAPIASLWAARDGGPLRVSSVIVRDGRLSVLRTPGHLVLLPALREQARARAAGHAEPPAALASPAGMPWPEDVEGGAAAQQSRPASPTQAGASYPKSGPPSGSPPPEERPVTLLIEHIEFDHVDVDLYDATLHRPTPYRVQWLEGQGTIDHVALPALAQPMALHLQARLASPGSEGKASASGTITPGLHDADLDLRLTGGDLLVLEPYLLKLGEGGVKSGRLDLQLDAKVARGAVRAPGRLTISGLQFNDAGGTFAGVERRAVLAALTKNGRLDVSFTLEGRLDDPKFALNERLGGRIAVGLAEAVGVSVKSAVQSVGDAIKGLLGGGAPPARKP